MSEEWMDEPEPIMPEPDGDRRCSYCDGNHEASVCPKRDD